MHILRAQRIITTLRSGPLPPERTHTQVWPGAYARGRAAAATGWRPFAGLRVILHGGKKLRPPLPFMMALVEAGGGQVLGGGERAMVGGGADPVTTLVLSSPACKADRAAQAWVARGGAVLGVELLLDFVSQERAPDPSAYCMFGTSVDASIIGAVLKRYLRWTCPPPPVGVEA